MHNGTGRVAHSRPSVRIAHAVALPLFQCSLWRLQSIAFVRFCESRCPPEQLQSFLARREESSLPHTRFTAARNSGCLIVRTPARNRKSDCGFSCPACSRKYEDAGQQCRGCITRLRRTAVRKENAVKKSKRNPETGDPTEPLTGESY